MKRHMAWMGIAGALALLAAGCRDDGVTGLEKAAVQPRGEPLATSIEVIPTSVQIDTGEYYWLTAILRDAEGRELQSPLPFHWTSSDPDLVEVSSEDARVILVAKSAGFVTVTAHYGRLSGSAFVTVEEGKGS